MFTIAWFLYKWLSRGNMFTIARFLYKWLSRNYSGGRWIRTRTEVQTGAISGTDRPPKNGGLQEHGRNLDNVQGKQRERGKETSG